MKRSMVWMAVAAWWLGASTYGQVLDLQTGRGADLYNEPISSVEGGLVSGDIDLFGARFNYKTGDNLMLMGNIASVDVGDDETAIGVAAMYQLATDLPVSTAVKGGYGMTMSGDVDWTDMYVEAIFSGPIDDLLGWYANVGVHILEYEFDFLGSSYSDDETFFKFGGGLTYAINDRGTIFGGIDMLTGDAADGTVVGGGFRWALE